MSNSTRGKLVVGAITGAIGVVLVAHVGLQLTLGIVLVAIGVSLYTQGSFEWK